MAKQTATNNEEAVKNANDFDQMVEAEKTNDQVKTPAEVEEEERLNNAAVFNFETKANSEKGFEPLEGDIFYKLTIEKSEVKMQPNKFKGGALEPKIMLTCGVEGMDGADVKDINGVVQKPGLRKLWVWMTMAVGFSKGKPSNSRKIISALYGVTPEALELKNLRPRDFVGKSCKAMLEVITREDGGQVNNVLKYGIL